MSSVMCPECGTECKNGLGVAVHYALQESHPDTPPDEIDTSDGAVISDWTPTEEQKRKIGEANSGENSWLYNIDRTEHPRYKEYSSLKSNAQRAERIKIRDNYTCQLCGATDTRLEAHHIDGNREDWSKENMITLCMNCHQKYHETVPLPLPLKGLPDKTVIESGGETYVVKRT